MQESIFGDPLLPLEERESIEEFEAKVRPAFQAFVDELAAYAGVQAFRFKRSSLDPFNEGGLLWLPMIILRADIPADVLTATGNKYFPPLGLTTFIPPQPDDVLQLRWLDPNNGGIIYVTSNGGITIDGESAARPFATDGRTWHDYTRTEWELSLPWDENSPQKNQPE